MPWYEIAMVLALLAFGFVMMIRATATANERERKQDEIIKRWEEEADKYRPPGGGGE